MNPLHSLQSIRPHFRKNCLTPNAIWIGLSIIGISIFLICMPKIYDDWGYMYCLKPWFDFQPPFAELDGGNILKYGFPWQEWCDTIREHYLEDNIRLGNIIGPILLIFPKWVGSSLMALCWIYTVWATFRIAEVNWRRSALVPVAIFLWVFGLKWREHLGSLIFQLNYIALGALTLALLLQLKKSSFSISHRILIFLLALITGAWHEGFAAPIGAGIIASLIFCRRPKQAKINMLIALLGLACGFAYLMISPNFGHRIDGEAYFELNVIFQRIPRVIFSWHFWNLPYLLLVAWYLYRKGWRQFLAPRFNLLFLCAIIASLSMALIVMNIRSGWAADFFSIPATLSLLNQLWHKTWSRYSLPTSVFGVCLLVPSLYTLLISDIYTIKYGRIYTDATREYVTTGHTQIYADVNSDDAKPYLTQRFISNNFIFNMNSHQSRYYRRNPKKEKMLILPKEVKDFTPQAGQPIPGRAGARMVGRSIVIPVKDSTSMYDRDVWFGPICRKSLSTQFWPFVSEADGRTYALMLFNQGKTLRPIFGVDSIN